MPHLVVDSLKRTFGSFSSSTSSSKKRQRNENDETTEDFWVIMMKVGPFEDWDQCVAYLNEWNTQTRGRARRLERGWELYQQHFQVLKLTMWGQYDTLDTVTSRRKAKKKTSRFTTTTTTTGVKSSNNRNVMKMFLEDHQRFFKTHHEKDVSHLKKIKLKHFPKV